MKAGQWCLAGFAPAPLALGARMPALMKLFALGVGELQGQLSHRHQKA